MRKGTFCLGFASMCVALSLNAANPILGEVELIADSRVERNAGVWVDDQYVGYVRNLRGGDQLVLVPGEHRLELKLIGYQNLRSTIVVEPGQNARYRVAMVEKPDLAYPDRKETARLRILVAPKDAAIFVNDAFAGHVDRFNGANGMRLKEGTYRFTIALPGYQPFETELALRAGQNYEIKTTLLAGGIDDQAGALFAGDPAAESQVAE